MPAGTAPGSPAHAGIDLVLTLLQNAAIRFPRTRGDRPPFVGHEARVREVPPHTRG